MYSPKSKEVFKIFKGLETVDGAGVRLRRMFGGMNTARITDPFLLLDQFGSSIPSEYSAGFPWHPHRGIETVTYLLEGKVAHEDSEGHSGTIYPGDAQWMTSGSGIFHQEMPDSMKLQDYEKLKLNGTVNNTVKGLQLWINIPSLQKMETPAYRSLTRESIPVIDDKNGNKVHIIAGEYEKVRNELPMKPAIDPVYIDVEMPPESSFTFAVKTGHTSFLNMISGEIRGVRGIEQPVRENTTLVFSRDGSEIKALTENERARFIIVSGKPLNEEIYWNGPIVMNTEEQIMEALSDLRNNKFVREKNPIMG